MPGFGAQHGPGGRAGAETALIAPHPPAESQDAAAADTNRSPLGKAFQFDPDDFPASEDDCDYSPGGGTSSESGEEDGWEGDLSSGSTTLASRRSFLIVRGSQCGMH